MSEAEGTPNDRLRLTVPDAARALGISPEAVRNRLSRGTLKSERESGTVYVLIDRNMVQYTDDMPGESTALTSQLALQMQARIDSLERQLEQANERDRENRRLLAAALERVPAQLEAPESPVTAREATEGAEEPRPGTEGPQAGTQGAQSEARRPWWRWVFGG